LRQAKCQGCHQPARAKGDCVMTEESPAHRGRGVGGAGVKRGYVHGKSDKTGSAPIEDPVHPTEMLATIYHSLGIDPETIIHNHLDQSRELVKARAVTRFFA